MVVVYLPAAHTTHEAPSEALDRPDGHALHVDPGAASATHLVRIDGLEVESLLLHFLGDEAVPSLKVIQYEAVSPVSPPPLPHMVLP